MYYKIILFLIFLSLLISCCSPVETDVDSLSTSKTLYLNDSDGYYKNYLIFKLKNCDTAINLAISDFKKNKYYLIVVGLPEVDSFKAYYYEYLKEKYNIEVLITGCIASEGTRCYSDKMIELIYKNGIPILGTAKDDARKLYNEMHDNIN